MSELLQDGREVPYYGFPCKSKAVTECDWGLLCSAIFRKMFPEYVEMQLARERENQSRQQLSKRRCLFHICLYSLKKPSSLYLQIEPGQRWKDNNTGLSKSFHYGWLLWWLQSLQALWHCLCLHLISLISDWVMFVYVYFLKLVPLFFPGLCTLTEFLVCS
jgi:hypothetical protein